MEARMFRKILLIVLFIYVAFPTQAPAYDLFDAANDYLTYKSYEEKCFANSSYAREDDENCKKAKFYVLKMMWHTGKELLSDDDKEDSISSKSK